MAVALPTIKLGFTAAVILAITAACASQEGSTTSEASTTLAAVDDAPAQITAPAERGVDELECRRIKPSGSRIGEKVCMWPEQWDKYTELAKKELEKIQSRGLTNNKSGG